LSVGVFSQEKTSFFLEGNIQNSKDDKEGIAVINISSTVATITNKEGNFKLLVTIGDTVEIRAIQFVTEHIYVTKETKQQMPLQIMLTPNINQLKEVTVTPYNLSGDLRKDVVNSNVKALNFYDFGIPGFKGERKEKIIPLHKAVKIPPIPIAIGINIDAIYKNLSGYYKELKTRRQWDRENVAVANIIRYFGEDHFKNSYHLEDDEIYPFVLSCVMIPNVISNFNNKNYMLVLEAMNKRIQEIDVED
jgi:hypothetical protein